MGKVLAGSATAAVTTTANAPERSAPATAAALLGSLRSPAVLAGSGFAERSAPFNPTLLSDGPSVASGTPACAAEGSRESVRVAFVVSSPDQ
ncbi:hypothetical protein [Halobaculum marinum]|uniref:Secreted protein n=1 Tax=Halobaculum marinum TaxID=3031996 RepID=A0ABD5X203_9EURY|nr:hypothetical protein [Halobaculum sp. DT55]